MNSEDLKSIPLFHELSDDALAKLSEVAEEQSFTDGQAVFKEGDEGDALYFIADGAVKIEKAVGDAGSKNKTLAIITTGDFFGEMSLFDGKPRSAGTVSLGDTKVYRFARGTFRSLMESDTHAASGLLFAIIKVCHQRIRSLNDKVVVYHEVGKAVAETDDLDKLIDVILKQILKATGAATGVVLLKEEFSGRLEIRLKIGLKLTADNRDAISESKGMVGAAMSTDEVILIHDLPNDSKHSKLESTGLESTSMLVSQIRVEGNLLGVLVLGHEDANFFDLDDVNLCMSVGSQAGQAIVNFRHKEEEDRRSKHGRQYVKF